MKEIRGLKPGEKTIVKGLTIEAVPAYNTNKKFHPKSDGKIGFVFSINGRRIYHAGDTDMIPEMESIGPDIALVPVSGTYVMNVGDALAVDPGALGVERGVVARDRARPRGGRRW